MWVYLWLHQDSFCMVFYHCTGVHANISKTLCNKSLDAIICTITLFWGDNLLSMHKWILDDRGAGKDDTHKLREWKAALECTQTPITRLVFKQFFWLKQSWGRVKLNAEQNSWAMNEEDLFMLSKERYEKLSRAELAYDVLRETMCHITFYTHSPVKSCFGNQIWWCPVLKFCLSFHSACCWKYKGKHTTLFMSVHNFLTSFNIDANFCLSCVPPRSLR